MDKPLISVVVPVYNVEDYLRRCLVSLASQTYGNLEIILVDDGSTDSSGMICDEFASNDSRAVVIHQENKWLSGARNAGLAIAKGDYICFVDSDDFVSSKYIATLYDGVAAGYDMSIVGFEYVDPEGKPTNKKTGNPEFGGLHEQSIIPVLRDECIKGMLLGNGNDDYMFGVVWNKLYPRQLIEGLRFSMYYSFEDVPFNLSVYSRVSKISFVNRIVYYYVQRQESICGALRSTLPRASYDKLKAFYDMINSVSAQERFVKRLLLQRIFSSNALRYRNNVKNTEYESPMRQLFKLIWRRLWHDYLTESAIPLKTRFFFAVSWNSSFMYKLYLRTRRNA